MFDYDRLSLDVKQQFAKVANENIKQVSSSSKDRRQQLDAMSTGSGESQLFGWDSPSPPSRSEAMEEDNNSIVHGLSELLRRCSSPGHQQQQQMNFAQQQQSGGGQLQHFQRHRSATIGNAGNDQQMYHQAMISSQQAQQRHRAIGSALSMDLSSEQQQNRRLSGGSIGFPAESMMFDCGASSGYGSPGAIGTPLASPAAASHAVQYIAHQLQKMFAADQGFCEAGMPVLGATTPVKTQRTAAETLAKCKAVPILPVGSPPSGLSTPSAVLSMAPANAVLVKATTTTTGTNKNSNKRKTSIATTTGTAAVAVPAAAADGIVATEDGFDNSEIMEFAELLSSPKRQPPPRYVCHICYQPGHYISDCPQRFSSPYEELTPYQGRKKCYGEFQCEQCKRKWTSQNSVANEAQSCIKCHIPVFPHKQLPVDKAIALGLVKLQRLPVTAVPASPPSGGTPTPQAMQEAAASIFFGLKNGSLVRPTQLATQLAI